MSLDRLDLSLRCGSDFSLPSSLLLPHFLFLSPIEDCLEAALPTPTTALVLGLTELRFSGRVLWKSQGQDARRLFGVQRAPRGAMSSLPEVGETSQDPSRGAMES